MNHDVVYNEQILSIAQNASSYVTTILVCQNTLIRSGISHILSGTQFVISEELPEQASGLPVLCLIHASEVADELSETVERLKAQWPSTRVALLAERMEPAAMVHALHFGVDGLCSTEMSRELLIKALELVMLGETFISSTFAVNLLDEAARYLQTSPDGAAVYLSGNGPATAATAAKLTQREVVILRHLTQGASNKQIARELGLMETTVKVHVKTILRKVNAANRTQAAIWAQQHMTPAANDAIIAAAE